jgi:hypothetical protein
MREIRERKEDAMDLRFSQRRGRHLIGIKEQIERWKTTISPDGSHLLVNTDSVSGLGPVGLASWAGSMGCGQVLPLSLFFLFDSFSFSFVFYLLI